MAIKYQHWQSETTHKARHLFVCDTDAEKPASGILMGDIAIALDNAKLYISTNGTTWTEKGSGGVGNVPTGAIFLWSGSIASIPEGYVICDGANGTPDLRDRFVVGAGSTYAVGANGGVTAHGHDYTTVIAHSHTVNITDSGHAHTEQRHSTSTGSFTGLTTAPDTSSSVNASLGIQTASAATGITAASVNAGVTTGTTVNAGTLPPYYALAYIMKT